MITLASPTRVTLALDIVRQLDDGALRGYHELGIVKHQIDLADTLFIEPHNGGSDIIECGDPRVPRDDTNICAKAAQLVREKICGDKKFYGGANKKNIGGVDKFLRVTIDKKIPVMGGMAGGSANAAAMLRGLNELWNLNLSADDFRALGRMLGMDVPFFFSDKTTAFDSEATGILKPVETDLVFHIILAIPDFGVSTKEAYCGIDYQRIGKNVSMTSGMIDALRENNFDAVTKLMHNDFELTIFEKHPRLKELRDTLLRAGCPAAVMSGSGSTIIGIASDESSAKKIASNIDCETIVCKSLSSY